jgi:hypothetical protein
MNELLIYLFFSLFEHVLLMTTSMTMASTMQNAMQSRVHKVKRPFVVAHRDHGCAVLPCSCGK